jgi:hypothetical protein
MLSITFSTHLSAIVTVVMIVMITIGAYPFASMYQGNDDLSQYRSYNNVNSKVRVALPKPVFTVLSPPKLPQTIIQATAHAAEVPVLTMHVQVKRTASAQSDVATE